MGTEIKTEVTRAEGIVLQWVQSFCLDSENILGTDGGGGWCTIL